MPNHVNFHVWRTLSYAYILYKWLCFCVLYCSVLYTVVQYLCFKPRMSGSKHKSSGDVAGTAKKRQLLYCTTILFKVLSCKIKNVFFILGFVFYVLFV